MLNDFRALGYHAGQDTDVDAEVPFTGLAAGLFQGWHFRTVNPIGSVGRPDARGEVQHPLQVTPRAVVALSAYLPDSPGIVSPVSGPVGAGFLSSHDVRFCLVFRPPLRLDVEINNSGLELEQGQQARDAATLTTHRWPGFSTYY